ncbi:hypothetical protein MHU86_6359 [Fragilaria crotonensis]|nr:hypothetical protein MHU86_6359 [Fragilaria crotonensis]
MAKPKNRSSGRRRKERNRSVRPQESSTNCEIEEQLERQRRKRSAESPEASAVGRPTTPPVLGDYEYDAATNAYFPKSSGLLHRKKHQTDSDVNNEAFSTKFQWRGHNLVDHDLCPMRLIPTSMIGHVTEVCSASRRYQTLRSHWAGRIVTNRMQVVPSARMTVDSRSGYLWTLMFPHLQRQNSDDRPTPDMPWDLLCKMYLHSSSRTFDVQQASSDYSRFPDIATLVDGGSFIRLGESSPRPCHIEDSMLDEPGRNTSFVRDRTKLMLRFAPRTSDDFPSLALLTSSRPGKMDVISQRPDNSNLMSVDVSRGACNDIAFHPLFDKGNFVVAVAPCITPSAKEVTIYADILYGASFHMKTCQFSKSDALCVDYVNENSILFGHRNGSISFCDTRTKQIQLVAEPQRHAGSSTSILSLANGRVFLAKKSFGSCYMFDIRKMSPRKKAALLWHLPVPSDQGNPTLSTYCSGLAVDPSQTFAVSPFSDSDRRGHFAVWSLTNGQLLGSKSCQKAASQIVQGQSGTGMPHCELRSTITPSWQFDKDSNGNDVMKRKSKAWSLWFKSGEVVPQAPQCAGSIHQLTFCGGPDEFLERQPQ